MTGNVVNPAGIPGTDTYACRILVVLPTQRTLQFPDKAPGVSCAGNRLCNSLCVPRRVTKPSQLKQFRSHQDVAHRLEKPFFIGRVGCLSDTRCHGPVDLEKGFVMSFAT